jgi:hypothetical protein
MIRTCPSCGYRTADDQIQYCSKCGYPFPAGPAPQATRAAQDRAQRTPRAAPAPAAHMPHGEPHTPHGGQHRQKKSSGGGAMPFTNLIARKYLKLIYFLGALAIVVVSLLGIVAGFSATGSASAIKAFTNTTALVVTPTASPLFWIGVLIFGSLVWRLFCEMVGVVVWMYAAISDEETTLADAPEGDDAAVPDGWNEGSVQCPRCGKVVPASEIRECEHCGVQGCSSCIRMMGLLKKTMTCKDCFENK